MKRQHYIYIFLILTCISCSIQTEETNSNAGINTDSLFIKSVKPNFHVSLTKSKLVIFDGDGTTQNILPYKNFHEFIEKTNWNSTVDTIINDERGIFIGKKAYNQRSFVRWLNDSTIVEIHAEKPQNFDINFDWVCGLTGQNKLLSIFFTKSPNNSIILDTVRIDFGFLDNGIDIVLKDKTIKTIDFSSFPD